MSEAGQVEARALAAFRHFFAADPVSVAVAPGRMNIVGEHTDYNQGFALPAAIDRHVGVGVRLRDDGKVAIRSDRYPDPVAVDRLPDRRPGTWADYALGVAGQLAARGLIQGGFEAAIVSEIPVGSGLSSSGALEVAVAVALLHASGVDLSPLEVAQLCQRAESEFVGARTGIMDQFTALSARAGCALLLDCRSLSASQVSLLGPQFTWLLADTRVHHQLASSSYNERRAQCEAAARALGAASLRDVTQPDLDRLEDPILLRRARHVVSEDARVLDAAEALRKRDAHRLGAILFASHSSLRDDFEVSCAELDRLVDVAASKPSVLGARMMGGGFGGCVVVLLESDRVTDVEHDLAQAYAKTFPQPPAFYRVRSVDGVMPSRG
jgi:galactokinase